MKNNHTKSPANPRILMIAPVFYPYPPIWPEGMVNAKLALAMKNKGWKIDIIAGGFSSDIGRYPTDIESWQELADQVHVIKIMDRKSISKRILNFIRGFTITGTALKGVNWSLSAMDKVNQLHKVNHYDFILSRAIPDFAHFAGLLAHRKTGLPWIANWNDPTPNHKFPPPYGDGPRSPLSSNTRKWYSMICKYCTWHTFPSERLKNYICSYLPGRLASKSSVIPHLAMKQFSVEPKPHEGFSICYAGSVLPPRDVTVFFEGVKLLTSKIDRSDLLTVRFLVDKPDLVAEKAKSLGIENIVKIENTVPYSEMPQVLARSDVSVIIEAPLEEGIFMPSKIADYVQIGSPILAIAPPIGTIKDILSEFGGGIAADCQSPDSVASALLTLYKHWQDKNLNQRFGSSSLYRILGEENILKLYMDLFNRLAPQMNSHANG